jgi:hypothetical protein
MRDIAGKVNVKSLKIVEGEVDESFDFGMSAW